MSDKKKWDLTSNNSLAGAAEWIRKRAGGELVLVIRPSGVAFAVDPAIQPVDAIALVRNELPQILQCLIDQRAGKTKK